MGFFSAMYSWLNVQKPIKVIHHINWLKKKTSYGHGIRCKRIIWKNTNFIHDKQSQKITQRDDFLILIFKTTKKSITNLILNGEQLEEGISKTVFLRDYMIVYLENLK